MFNEPESDDCTLYWTRICSTGSLALSDGILKYSQSRIEINLEVCNAADISVKNCLKLKNIYLLDSRGFISAPDPNLA